MLQFRHLRYFVKIVEAGSFSRASAQIHIAQPALSKQIAELEDAFGVALLHRYPRGVKPTAAGEVLYRESVDLIRQVDGLPDLVRSAQGEIHGIVCFGMASSVAPGLTGKMMEICKATLPKVTLRFITADSQTLRERVASNAVDLALVFENEPEVGFKRDVLFRQRLYLASRRQGKVDKSTSLAKISKLPLMLPTPSNVLRRALERELALKNLRVEPIAESDLFDVVLSAVEAGLGHAVLPKADFSDMPGHQDIATVPIAPPIYLTACLIATADRPLSRAAAAVQAQLGNFIRSQVDQPTFRGVEWVDAVPYPADIAG